MSETIISVKSLVKIYKMGDVEVHALRGVNVDIRQGDFVAIMGKSGSGKSTFMNILGCLDIPTRGEYLLDGVDVSHETRREAELTQYQRQKNIKGAFSCLDNAPFKGKSIFLVSADNA